MIPAASVTGLPAKGNQPVIHHSAARTGHAHTPDTARSSGGESAAAQVRLDSAKAVTAPDQTAVAPRLRDQENAERTHRSPQAKDAPTGPPPSFEESPLERQARVAFDPPDLPPGPEARQSPPADTKADPAVDTDIATGAFESAKDPEPAPTKSERAEASFAETRTLAQPKEAAKVDVSR